MISNATPVNTNADANFSIKTLPRCTTWRHLPAGRMAHHALRHRPPLPGELRRGVRDARSEVPFFLLAGTISKFYRDRSWLYQSEILQENMRLKALAEIYIMHSFAKLCNLNFLLKNCQNVSRIFKNFGKSTKFCE